VSSLGLGIVLRRAQEHRLILGAAFGTILLATTALVALLLFATTVTETGVQRRLAIASADDVGITVTAQVTHAGHDALDRRVRETAKAAYAGSEIQVVETARSASYALPGQEDRGDDAKLTVFGMYEGLEQHSNLAAGR
jgi:hypothetical protein